MTELEAINKMLRDAGDSPVSTLVNDGVNDTDTAQQILAAKTIQILDPGQNFNKKIVTLSPDSNGNIQLGNNVLRVDATDYTVNVVARSSTLWDLDNNTDVFTDAVEVEIVYSLDFEDIPPATQNWIVAEASREYQMLTVGDAHKDAYLAEQEMLAKARFRKADALQRDSSFIDGTNNRTNDVRARYGRSSL